MDILTRRFSGVARGLAVAVSAALMLGTGAAHADEAIVTDRAGDGYSGRWGDVLQVRADHRSTGLLLETTFPRKHTSTEIWYYLSTTHKHRGPEWLVFADSAYGPPTFVVYPTRAKDPWAPMWKKGRCEQRIRWGDPIVSLTVPRACLGNPDWVRVSTYAGDDELPKIDWAGHKEKFTRELYVD